MTLVLLIGWQFLYCSFSIYLRYHPDGLGGSVNHCTVHYAHFSNHIQSFSLGPLNSKEASQLRASCIFPHKLRAAEHKYKQVKLFICSFVLWIKHSRQLLLRCVYETRKVSHRWTHYKASYLPTWRLFGSITGLFLKQGCSVSPIYDMVGSKQWYKYG